MIIQKKNLKYSLTTKKILETDNMLKHVKFEKNNFNIIDRPYLKQSDYRNDIFTLSSLRILLFIIPNFKRDTKLPNRYR